MPPQRGAALAEVYRAADVVAVPSHNESFGLVALEAQACGTPVVAAAVGGLPIAVRDQVTGLLVPDHNPRNWARVLSDVVLRPALREELACKRGSATRGGSPGIDDDALLDGYARRTT